MTDHEKQIIIDVYNIVKDKYTKAETTENKKIRREQCFIIMHLMQNLRNEKNIRIWDEYKRENDLTIEKKWFPDMEVTQ